MWAIIGSRIPNQGQIMRYNWQHPLWPKFEYDLSSVQELLYKYALEASALLGGLNQTPQEMQTDAAIDLMVSEALSTSEIEGEKFSDDDVRSSIKRELGISSKTVIRDPKAVGISQLMIAVRNTFNVPLTEEQLFEWHKMVIALSAQNPYIDIGRWRTSVEPMQIISGGFGHEKVHFEAPPSHTLEKEMARFIDWFNNTHPARTNVKIPGPVRAAIAHLYFESLHPFSDGNGRIGRAISEKALSEDLGRPVLLSLSTTIYRNKKEYYKALSNASRYQINITPWIHYFVETVYLAQLDSKKQINFVLQKAKFWQRYQAELNDRQEQVIARMFKSGVAGFEGGINAQKYMKITDCSKATATRDLAELLEQGCIVRLPGSGRNTRYELVLPVIF